MPTIPSNVTLTANAVDILNAIRNSATTNYRDYVPVANPTAESIRQIGSIVMQYESLQNEFISTLANRIGRVLLLSKLYKNPWSAFKKGMLEYGETIEEIFVAIAKPFEYDTDTAQNEVFKKEIPDVKTAFHYLNYQKFYKVTINHNQLAQAFLSWSGIVDLISAIVDSIYSAANYDEFQTMKYLLALRILNGQIKAVTITDTSDYKKTAAQIKGISNALEFMSTEYNLGGVPNFTKKDNQYILMNANFDAEMDVEVLATAFNMDKAEFMGHRVLVDGFGKLDTTRLAELLGTEYYEFSSAELTALDAIPAIIVDRDWFMIYDNLNKFTEIYNAQGLYWNYFYHTWKIFSTSPYANAVMFLPNTPSIVSVEVTPATASASDNQVIAFTAEVTTLNFASKEVIWSVSAVDSQSAPIASPNCTISANGVLSIGDMTTGDVITVTATSAVDSTKKDTATVTIA